MTDAQKLVIIAENQQRVFNAGYAKGIADGECKKTYLEVTKTPTCYEEGEAIFKCEGCGAVGTEILPVIDHDYIDGMCSMCNQPDPYHINNYPVQDSLTGLFVLGGTSEDSLINHAKNSTSQAYEVNDGTLVYEDAYMTSGGGYRDDTRIVTEVESNIKNGVTWIAVFKGGHNKADPIIMGNRRQHSPSALGMSLSPIEVEICIDRTSKGLPYNYLVGEDNFAIVVLTATETGCRVVRYSNGILDISNPLLNYEGPIDYWDPKGPYQGKNYNTISVGGDFLSNGCANINVSMVALHDGIVNDEDLAKICDFMYVHGTRRGLTIE